MKLDFRAKIIPYSALAEWRKNYSGPSPLVATSGCFDLLHAGHAIDLEKIRNLGDALIVGINDDASVKRYKGEGRPVVNQDHRVATLASLQCVDFVTVFPEDVPAEFIRRCRPDIYTKGSDWSIEKLPQADKDALAEAGSKLLFTERTAGQSTTALIEKVVQLYAREKAENSCLQKQAL